MANLQLAEKKTLKWEGGYCDVPGDRGGETIFGIARNFHPKCGIWKIMDEYKASFKPFGKSNYKELENLCLGNAEFNKYKDDLYRELFWDKIKGDDIQSQDVANALYDWAVNSGPGVAIKNIQRIVGVADDGVIGPKTIETINNYDSKELNNKLCDARATNFRKLAEKGQNAKFLKGWLNRVNDFYI